MAEWTATSEVRPDRDAAEERGPLCGRPRRLTDGEQRHDAGRGQFAGVEGAHVGDPAAVQAGRLGQFGQAVADWSSTPWTPAGPSRYGATWVT